MRVKRDPKLIREKEDDSTSSPDNSEKDCQLSKRKETSIENQSRGNWHRKSLVTEETYLQGSKRTKKVFEVAYVRMIYPHSLPAIQIDSKQKKL